MCMLFSKIKIIFTEKRTACYISWITEGVLSGYNYFKTFLTLKTVSICRPLSSLSRWDMTVINGKLNIRANYKELLEIFLFYPETTQSAYSGKNEHKLETTCFSLWPATSMKDSILLELSSHYSIELMKWWLNSFPLESNAIIWWLLDCVIPDIN